MPMQPLCEGNINLVIKIVSERFDKQGNFEAYKHRTVNDIHIESPVPREADVLSLDGHQTTSSLPNCLVFGMSGKRYGEWNDDPSTMFVA